MKSKMAFIIDSLRLPQLSFRENEYYKSLRLFEKYDYSLKLYKPIRARMV